MGRRMTQENEEAGNIVQFDASSIIQSAKYRRYRDLLSVILEEDMIYTEDKVDELIKEALSKSVTVNVNI